MTKAFYCLLAASVLTAIRGAGQPAVDKSAFDLFNPTPTQYLRDLATDDRGAPETPYTVDAGHFQFEMTLVSYTADRDSSSGATLRRDAWAFAPITLKVGLLNQLDAQLGLEPYQLVYEREGTNRLTRRGFGDTTVRLKYNFWGNDAGPTAFAAMPFVKFPTSAEGLGNRSVEGGLILPLAVALPRDFDLGLKTRFDAVRDEDERDYHAEFINSVALSHDLFGNLAGYVEFLSVVSSKPGTPWMGTFDTGLICALTDNVQLTAGASIGLTRSAEDWNFFAGLAWRF